MYFPSTSTTSGRLAKTREGLLAPEERKCRWSLEGWDYGVSESRGWHRKWGTKSLLRLLTLPPPDAQGRAVPWKEEAAAATAPADAEAGQKQER